MSDAGPNDDHTAGDDDTGTPQGAAQRRREAVAAAARQLSTPQASSESLPPFAVQHFAPHHAVLALAGTSDPTGLERLQAELARLHQAHLTEVVLDLSQLSHSSPRLARLLARWRIRLLTHGTAVELYDAPPSLSAEMGSPHDGF